MIVRHVTAIKYNHKTVDITPAAKRNRRSTACVSPTDNGNSVLLPAPKSASGYQDGGGKYYVKLSCQGLPSAGCNNESNCQASEEA